MVEEEDCPSGVTTDMDGFSLLDVGMVAVHLGVSMDIASERFDLT